MKRVNMDEREQATVLEALRRYRAGLTEAGRAEGDAPDGPLSHGEIDALCRRVEGPPTELRITDWLGGLEGDTPATTEQARSFTEQVIWDNWFQDFPGWIMMRAEDGRFYGLAVRVEVVEETDHNVRCTIKDLLDGGEEDPERRERLKGYLAALGGHLGNGRAEASEADAEQAAPLLHPAN